MLIDPTAARCFRLTFGVGVATLVAYGAALPLGYLLILIVLAMLAAPVPPPGPKGTIGLVVITVMMALYGMLLGPVLDYVPVAGVLLSLCGVALAAVVSNRPGMAIVGTLMILSSTIIAVFAAQSSAAAAALVRIILSAMVGAVIIAQLAHALFPEPPVPLAPGTGSRHGSIDRLDRVAKRPHHAAAADRRADQSSRLHHAADEGRIAVAASR